MGCKNLSCTGLRWFAVVLVSACSEGGVSDVLEDSEDSSGSAEPDGQRDSTDSVETDDSNGSTDPTEIDDSNGSTDPTETDDSKGLNKPTEGFVPQGYGANISSAPGGNEIYTVTSLADDGTPGTLRDAVSESGRDIVFEVGGTIVLDSRLAIKTDYLTIDGTTAPYPGITITHRVGEYHGLILDGQRRHTHDIMIRGIRFLGVYDIDPVHKVGRAIFSTDGDCRSEGCDGGVSNLVIDRITLAYASDKFTLWGKTSNVTVSNSFFYGSNKAFLVSFYGASYDLPKRGISLHHNVFTKNEERNPQLIAWTTDFDMRNNIVHDWRWYGMRIRSAEGGNRGIHNVDANIVNNLFLPGDGQPSTALVYNFDTVDGCSSQGNVRSDTGMGELWVSGNSFEDNCDSYSTVPNERFVPEFAQVSTQQSHELCPLPAKVGAPFFTEDETKVMNDLVAQMDCLP